MSYASRQSQSKAQTEANAKILRALVKQPENKVCADCKRNDPRWASWNIGCFLCIRCSGIHRSMGTHISKVKSIDLDIWTPEQMTSVQKWGNARANAYWEAHLKAGHSPPEHKVESFIRSKYESRRWAKEGPPPEDPSTLDADGGAAAAAAAAAPPPAAAPAATSSRQAAPPARPAAPIDLLSDPSPSPAAVTPASNGKAPVAAAAPASTPAAAPPKASGGGGGLFDLDWHEPAPAASATSPTTASGARGKNDILSLYSSANAAPPQQQQAFQAQPAAGAAGMGGLDAFGGLSFGSPTSSVPPTATSNPWGAPPPAAPAAQPSGNVWASAGNAAGNDLWGDLTPASTAQPSKPQGKDAFADIWGDFK